LPGTLKALFPKYRLEFLIKLLEYTLPKPVAEETNDNMPKSNFLEDVYHQMRNGKGNEYKSTLQSNATGISNQ
jgi:hypothetical protein